MSGRGSAPRLFENDDIGPSSSCVSSPRHVLGAALSPCERGKRSAPLAPRLSNVLRPSGAEQVIQNDAPERRGADAVEREAAERELEVAGAEHERDCDSDEIARVREV